MSQIQFLADNNLDADIIRGVLRREPSIQFEHARDLDLHEMSDPDLLDYAAKHNFVIVSHDVRTMIHYAEERVRRGEKMSGLLIVRQLTAIKPVIESLLLLWLVEDSDYLENKILWLPNQI